MKKSVNCPICRGQVLLKKNAWACSGKSNVDGGCGFSIPSVVLGHILTPEEVGILVAERKIGPISDFNSRRGDFSAYLKLIFSEDDARWSIEFDFLPKKTVHEMGGEGFSKTDYLFSDEIKRQISKFSDKRRGILESCDFLALPEDLQKRIIHSLDMANVSYSITGGQVSAASIDRTESFIFGLPFLSANYPVPSAKSGGQMYPLMQINLEQVGDATHHKFPLGLLQVWFSIDDIDALVRFIPASDLFGKLIDFETSNDYFDRVVDYAPDNWPRVDNGCCIKIESMCQAGVVVPSISESLMQDVELSEIGENLVLELRGVEESFSPDNFNGNSLFNLFGNFSSSTYKSDDVDSCYRSFICIPLCAGNLYLNIFFDGDGLDGRFFSSIGR